MKFDHLNLPVSNLDRSRDWYVSTLGLKVEFEIAASRTVSLQDGEGFAIFLQEKPGAYVFLGQGGGPNSCFLHNPGYDFNDAVIPLGAGYLAALVEEALPLK